ncbi:MAG TPA: M67 family metallopeptidase [Acidobacteriota bacterium]|nr:M67 family metallopeptidase [Acidobacteriota bacterium]
MELHIPSAQWDRITHWLKEAHPREGCGLLGGRRVPGIIEVLQVFPAPNAWPADGKSSQRNRFRISPAFHRRVHGQLKQEGLEIVGVFHSHPDGPSRPSSIDRRLAWPDLVYCIVEVADGRVKNAAVWLPPRLSRQAVLKITGPRADE